jgi:hypothetical protein
MQFTGKLYDDNQVMADVRGTMSREGPGAHLSGEMTVPRKGYLAIRSTAPDRPLKLAIDNEDTWMVHFPEFRSQGYRFDGTYSVPFLSCGQPLSRLEHGRG